MLRAAILIALLLPLAGCRRPCCDAPEESVRIDLPALRSAMHQYLSDVAPAEVSEPTPATFNPLRTRTVPPLGNEPYQPLETAPAEPAPVEAYQRTETLLAQAETYTLAEQSQHVDILTFRGWHDGASWCQPCNFNHDTHSYICGKNGWVCGSYNENPAAHFRIVDLETDWGQQVERDYRTLMQQWFREQGITDENQGGPYALTFVAGELVHVHRGRYPGSSPNSQAAIDHAVGLFYKGRSRQSLNKVRDAGRSDDEIRQLEAQDETYGRDNKKELPELVAGNASEVDMPALIDKIAPGGVFKIGDSATLIVPLDVTPEFEDRTVRVEDDDVRLKYKFGLIAGTLKVRYLTLSQDGRTLKVGLKGMPDMPVTLKWGRGFSVQAAPDDGWVRRFAREYTMAL